MTEKNQYLQQLIQAIVSGKAELARQSTYGSLTKGGSLNDVLDSIMEAVDILFDLNEIGGTDQGRLTAAESALNSSLDALHDELNESEKRLNMKATVGPVGLRAGSLMSIATSALLRSAGFQCFSLSKTQTPLELLRNSEELGANLVVPMLSNEDVEQRMSSLVDEIQRGGFKSKFLVIPIVLGLPEHMKLPLHAMKNSGEAVSEALRWAHQRATCDF